MIKLGIDVGGTNTDGVILDAQNNVIGSTKTATTQNVFDGINQVLTQLIDEYQINPEEITIATLGTTHCTNAIVERRNLNKVGIVRLCLPSGTTVPPLAGWPEDLIESMQAISCLIHGGYEYNGDPISVIKDEELDEVIQQFQGKVDSIAITGVFSPVMKEQEIYAAEYLAKAFPHIPISISSEIGSIGMIERENATILNASLMNTIQQVTNGFEKALQEQKIHANMYLGQNDGTLMSHTYARKYPIYTIACGPTNSIRGAAELSDEPNAIVVDIGGTTTDVGVLQQGFPRQTSLAVEVGGVRTNYRMPDIYAIGLGGGTRIKQVNGNWEIGPNSVGHELLTEAIVFGGNTLTATDIAIGIGEMTIEEADESALGDVPIEELYKDMVTIVEDAIDRMKTNADDMPVVLVGGGASLMPTNLKGASKVIRPPYASVANAVGAALGDVSGTVERIFLLDSMSHKEAIEEAKKEAIENAISAGANPNQISVIQLEDIPLAYLPGNAIVIRVKVAGPLVI